MWFQSWAGVVRVLVVGVAAYAGLVLLLRVSGKRTLSKMNAFDFIVTVALGSTLASVILSKSVALVEGLVAFALLIFLQFAVTWLSVRTDAVEKLVKAEPRLIFYQGAYLRDAMRQERVTEAEIRAAARAEGQSSMDQVGAVVLETDASFSVVPKLQEPPTALQDVRESEPQAARNP